MALTLFLFKVSQLDVPLSIIEPDSDGDTQSLNDLPTARYIDEENLTYLVAKVMFRGIHLWSNNVRIVNNEASFVARGKKPKKFNFNIASGLMPDDRLRIEFYTINAKKRKKKLVGVLHMMLESLIEAKHFDLPNENLSGPNNELLSTTVHLRVYYTPPDIDKKLTTVSLDEKDQLIDWKSMFDEEGRHGGHRYRHVYSKHDGRLRKIRAKLIGRADDADSDSYSDTDFEGGPEFQKGGGPMDEKERIKMQHNDLELLEKGLGRYAGNPFEVNEWQIMVHIIQGRDFPGLNISPYVVVEIGDQKRKTVIQKISNSPYFGEFFNFDFALPAMKILEKVIFIRVHDSIKYIGDIIETDPIGVFRLDIATVYNEKDHSFERKWAQLINPENVGAPCGHLLLSISVTERGVPTKNLVSETGQEDDEFKDSKTLIPAAMPRRLFPVQLKITLYSARDLPEMMTDFLTNISKKILQSNTWAPIDSFVEVTYNTMVATTEDRNGVEPVWGEALSLMGRFPPLVRTIKIAVRDHSTIGKNRTISSFFIDLFSISETNPAIGFLPVFGPTWVFLYGSLREFKSKNEQDGLNEGMGEAIAYKGSLLMAIESVPVNPDSTPSMDVQRESGIQVPEDNKFPMKRNFLLFGAIFDVSMIDNAYGNSTIAFELSIGPSGYLKPNELAASVQDPKTSLTRPYLRMPIHNNDDHFRLPIEFQKPIVFTYYEFHDYIYRISLSNRLKNISERLTKKIRDLESKIKEKVPPEEIKDIYKDIVHQIDALSCGCGEDVEEGADMGTMPSVHPNLCELLNAPLANLKMNDLDSKRRAKLLHNVESLKTWSAKDEYDEKKPQETVAKLYKIARAFQQMAADPQPALPDIFLWMICDTKRVAYARFQPEDLFFNLCQGEKGQHNGRVQTIFLKTPRLTGTPLNPSTNAKVQLFLWLGMKDYAPYIYRQLPSGFDPFVIPLKPGIKSLRYSEQTYYELRCHCFKARALTAADETGLSDPFLSITVGNETQTTPIIRQTLCPQWNVTLNFQNLVHIGSKETAEEIIGHVVVECYDYDDSGDGPDMIGRFSTTAKLNIFSIDDSQRNAVFDWYEFKLGESTAGELLAVFQLIEVTPQEHQDAEGSCGLEEIQLSPENFPADMFVTKLVNNKIYQIPVLLMPNMKNYEIEILFWGLRECRPRVVLPIDVTSGNQQKVYLEPIEAAEVTIECSGIRKTRNIKNVQKYPNFESDSVKPDNYTMVVSLPDGENFWPHISIRCVQLKHFGVREIVGNLVVTDLHKYLQKPLRPLSATDEALANAVNELSKRASYDFNRVRRSVIEAYYAVLASKDDTSGNKKLAEFKNKMQSKLGQDGNDSQVALIHHDALQNEKDGTGTGEEGADKSGLDDEEVAKEPLTEAEKKKRDTMEKTATWWHRYYASKAQLKLDQRAAMDMNEGLQDSYEVFADFLAQANVHGAKKHSALWNKVMKIFSRAKKAKSRLRNLAAGQSDMADDGDKNKSAVDASVDLIEIDRLKELTLIQTFDIVENQLEDVFDYEGFTDCVDTFPLYKGKGSSRSDEPGDDSRVFTKFKGKFRIRELPTDSDSQRSSLFSAKGSARMSINPMLINPELKSMMDSKKDSNMETNRQMLQFDFNKNPITVKCRLYAIKAILYRGWDKSGKADPFLKVLLNDTVIVNDSKEKLQNTLEPVFGKSFEFDVQIPLQTILCIQLWDWDMVGSDDLIAETKIDIENRWLSCHRATCGLSKRYDSSGYNSWRDTKKPSLILNTMCETANLNPPNYSLDFHSVTVGEENFECDPDIVEFIKTVKETGHRKAHHETVDDYIRENTALTALHGWGKKINQRHVLVSEHIECRPLYNPEFPETEQGKLEMWLDLFPLSRPPVNPMIDITPPNPVSYQLRLTVWNTADVELSDENFLTGEKTSDIYVKAWILGEPIDAQKTDVHYRSLTGEGNFNWRFVFDFKYLNIEEKLVHEAKDSVFQVGNTLKKIPPRITIRVYDEDFFSDDFLGECILNLTHLQVGARTSKRCKADILLNPKNKSVNLFEKNRIAGWWPMIAPTTKDEIRDKALIGGKLEAEFSLMTAEEAEKNPAGKGREAPQQLEEPNRPKTSFLWFTSPLKTLRYVIWGNFKWTIILALVLFVIAVFFLFLVWSLPGEVVHQILTKLFNTVP